jgi:structural maintenance of chromosome 4
VDHFLLDSTSCKKETLLLKTRLEEEERILEEIQGQLRHKTQVFQEEIERKQRDLDPIVTCLHGLESKHAVFEAEKGIVEEKVHGTNAFIGLWVLTLLLGGERDLKLALGNLDELQGKLQTTLDLKRDQEEEWRLEQEWDGQGRVEELKEEQETLLGDITSLHAQIHEAKVSLESSKSQSKVLTSLMAQKSIKGVCGRLGDLGSSFLFFPLTHFRYH